MSISPLSKKLSIAQADDTLPHRYDILVNDKNELQWFEGSDSEDTVRAGQPVTHKWTFFGGGACETVDMGKGGYFFSCNCTVCNPFRIRPRPETTSVTLTTNTTPVTHFFEEATASAKYLYALAGTKTFTVKLSTNVLTKTKDFAPTTAVNFKTGSYIGNGSNNRKIIGLGFQPDIVLLKADSTQWLVLKTASMPATKSKIAQGTALATGYIDTLDTDGFTVDASSNVDDIEYFWAAWEKVAGYIDEASYTGNGADDRWFDADDEATMNFNPDLVIIAGDTATLIIAKPSTLAGDLAQHWCTTQADAADHIQELGTGGQKGFQLGTNDDVNKDTETYYYVAFKALSEQFKVGTYTGDAVDDRGITDPAFRPACLLVTATTRAICWRTDKNDGDNTMYFANGANVTDHIQAFLPNGFQVGTHVEANANGETFHYMAWKREGTPVCGKAAVWNGVVELPLGSNMDSHGLTTVADDAAADTWTRRSGLRVQFFERLTNKIARAYDDNQVSLCSADDLDNFGNWGAPYSVGPPDTVITDLVEWGAELAVPTTDGMYMFDGVATSRQQLPLMGGIKDADNGKNSLNWLGLILVPTKGGLLRWQYGAAKAVGPDSIFGYVEAEGVANEPIHLQHFGLAYLEDWIYEAVYDGTNYHIIYARPFGEGFQWDFLLTSSSAIKTLFVDSNAVLWYGLGNNLSSIQLSRSGAPTGGNYGEASLTGSFYTSEKVLAEGANVRCRMAKVETDNNQTTLTWKLYSIRDGATAEQVGAAGGFKTDGEQKLYWTAASNLLARRLRYRLDFACSSFSPETTPPECLVLEFHGDALPDDADLIRVVVSLDSEGRANKTVYDELAAHENAGVRRVRSPITDEILYVTIYRRELEWVKQKGTEPPKVGVMLYMRRGDIA